MKPAISRDDSSLEFFERSRKNSFSFSQMSNTMNDQEQFRSMFSKLDKFSRAQRDITNNQRLKQARNYNYMVSPKP